MGGHPRSQTDSVVDLSVKTIESAESDEENAGSSGVETVIEQIRKNWQNINRNSYYEDTRKETEDDEVLTLKVPSSVKSIVIERDGKKQKFNLN